MFLRCHSPEFTPAIGGIDNNGGETNYEENL
jgi:hypothetical protein